MFSPDGSGDLTFQNFLKMMSIFSDHAPRNVKAEYAFKIYDFDNDDALSDSDLEEVCATLILLVGACSSCIYSVYIPTYLLELQHF